MNQSISSSSFPEKHGLIRLKYYLPVPWFFLVTPQTWAILNRWSHVCPSESSFSLRESRSSLNQSRREKSWGSGIFPAQTSWCFSSVSRVHSQYSHSECTSFSPQAGSLLTSLHQFPSCHTATFSGWPHSCLLELSSLTLVRGAFWNPLGFFPSKEGTKRQF